MRLWACILNTLNHLVQITGYYCIVGMVLPLVTQTFHADSTIYGIFYLALIGYGMTTYLLVLGYGLV